MKNKMLTCKTPIGYDDPALEFSAGIEPPRATGGQPPALFGGFFVSVGMASYIPIMGWPCGEPKGSPIPVDRTLNLYGLLTLFKGGGRENGISFNRSTAMRLNRFSAHHNSLSAEENLTTKQNEHITESDLIKWRTRAEIDYLDRTAPMRLFHVHELECAWRSLEALSIEWMKHKDSRVATCGAELMPYVNRMSEVFYHLDIVG